MKSQLKGISLIFFLSISFLGCQEVYIADLEKVEPLLVVEGLVTNQPGPYRIKLSVAGRFQEPPVNYGVSGAQVSILVSDGTREDLQELSTGDYYTSANFRAEIGKHYTLLISTLDGHQYTSLPQEILPPLTIDSIYGVFGERVFYRHSSVSNTLFPFNVNGTYAFIYTSGSGASVTRFRYSTSLYVQYGVPISDVTVNHCWIKRTITSFQPTDVGFFSNLDGASEEVGFAPHLVTGLPHMGFPAGLYYDQVRVLIHNIYTLNQASYAFHKAKNDQLNTDGRIFDPINAQLPGNMQCISDPERAVLGLFEASSETKLTYRIVRNSLQGALTIIPLPAMDNIPDEGCLTNQFPPFWVN
jgi:hypothetical protein